MSVLILRTLLEENLTLSVQHENVNRTVKMVFPMHLFAPRPANYAIFSVDHVKPFVPFHLAAQHFPAMPRIKPKPLIHRLSPPLSRPSEIRKNTTATHS
jgi:hypothetical protein